MTHSNIEWTLTFGEEKVHDSLARLVDEITPGLIDRLATDPSAYPELITASELVATRAEGLLAETVLSARHAGLTWAQVGKALGIDGQAAQQRFTGTQREDLRERFRRLEAETLENSVVAARFSAPEPGASAPSVETTTIGHQLDDPRLPPVGTRVTVDNDEFPQVQRGGAYGWHGVAFTSWTWTLEFDNQQWDHATTYLNKPPAGEGWQRIGRWGTTVYWKRPTNLPILPGAPKPESFYSERKLRKELERNRGEQPSYEAVGQVIGATVGGAMAQIIKGP
jgi:hypothetical protein